MGLLSPCKTCKSSKICFACLSNVLYNSSVPKCPLCRTKYILDYRFGLHSPAATPTRAHVFSPTVPTASPILPGPLSSDDSVLASRPIDGIALGSDIAIVPPARIDLSYTYVMESVVAQEIEMEDEDIVPRNLMDDFDRALVDKVLLFPELKEIN